jgi:hypothetical protein
MLPGQISAEVFNERIVAHRIDCLFHGLLLFCGAHEKGDPKAASDFCYADFASAF